MSLPGDKFEMVAGEWMKQGADLSLPLNKPWPRQLKFESGQWKSQPQAGINVFVLMRASFTKGYESPYWLTLREGEQAGGTLRESQSGISVTSWRWRDSEDGFKGDISSSLVLDAQDPVVSDEGGDRSVAMRPIVVFNIEQWDGLTDLPLFDYHIPTFDEALESAEMIASTEAPCEIKIIKDSSAFYNPSLNYIQIPPKNSFASLKEYYKTLFEQFGHALASKHNMNLWEGDGMEDLSSDVSFRALYAKMVAAMLAYEAGVDALS